MRNGHDFPNSGRELVDARLAGDDRDVRSRRDGRGHQWQEPEALAETRHAIMPEGHVAQRRRGTKK